MELEMFTDRETEEVREMSLLVENILPEGSIPMDEMFDKVVNPGP